MSDYNTRDPGLIPGSGRSPGEGNGNPLQYSCLENPMDGGVWWVTAHGIAKSWIRLSDFTFTFSFFYIVRASQVSLGIKILPANAGDTGEAGSIPGLGRSLGGGHGKPLQDSCLENPMGRGTLWATVHGITKSWAWLKQLSMHAFMHYVAKMIQTHLSVPIISLLEILGN